ncbi:iron hydrogenase assembly protein [Blastocystis sp. subtype 4]|uniref:iron hydrogenase assembly protein n=1 Tax=Blastocystis sp. subtype 4 TaxID=944170 RepID=UPI000711A2B5|nr:iron hydrogenase assembly protein [Blastocystis sp. subtype 4]KNB42158.1 iron hydrogenase assembly protein [Blastocystis sp. subtype 4]|eukprot:XP_014525601.1 iron hydrogenase assembly protein [Blastocystis sp. subtype 4]
MRKLSVVPSGHSYDLSQQQLEDLIKSEDPSLVNAYIVQANSITESIFSNYVYLHGFMGIFCLNT